MPDIYGWEEEARRLKKLIVGCKVKDLSGHTSSGRGGDSDILEIELVCEGKDKKLVIKSVDTFSGSGLNAGLEKIK